MTEISQDRINKILLMRNIVGAVSLATGISAKDIRSLKRFGGIAQARGMAYEILRSAGYTWNEVGKKFKKDHTTIMTVVRRQRELLEKHEDLRIKRAKAIELATTKTENIIDLVRIAEEREMKAKALAALRKKWAREANELNREFIDRELDRMTKPIRALTKEEAARTCVATWIQRGDTTIRDEVVKRALDENNDAMLQALRRAHPNMDGVPADRGAISRAA